MFSSSQFLYLLSTYITHIYCCILQASLVGEDKVRELGSIQLCVSVGIEKFPHLVGNHPAHSEEHKLQNLWRWSFVMSYVL